MMSPPVLPNHDLTPGVILSASASQICVPGYAGKVRNVTVAVKRKVFAEYHLKYVAKTYEIDHLISLELGGSNDIRNLWPQSYLTKPWNAHVKDHLENVLHAQVCAGKVPLSQAQTDIASGWIAAYGKYVPATHH